MPIYISLALYIVKNKKCVDLRDVGRDAVLKHIAAAVCDQVDLAASEEVGSYLRGKGIDAIIFPSVTGSGANIAVFLDADPPPRVMIANRDKIIETLRRLGS